MTNLDSYEKKKKIEKMINNMTLMSDPMVKSVFEDPACTGCLVRTLMGDKNLKIKDFQIQRTIPSLRNHSVILDVLAILEDGKAVNVEIQLEEEKADPHRIRIYSSMVDNLLLPKGDEYKNLPDKYVFMVTKDDYFGLGRQIYSFENMMEDDGKVFLKLNDGSHLFYVSASVQDDSELGRLLHDLRCKNPEDMFNKLLAERFDFFKNNPKGRITMYSELRELVDEIVDDEKDEWLIQGRKEGREEGRKEGREENKRKVAAVFIADGKYSYQELARFMELPLEEIERIAEELSGE